MISPTAQAAKAQRAAPEAVTRSSSPEVPTEDQCKCHNHNGGDELAVVLPPGPPGFLDPRLLAARLLTKTLEKTPDLGWVESRFGRAI